VATVATLPRIILLDDHPLILDGLATFIANAGLGAVVGRYVDTESALASLAAAAPDVAIVDVKVHGSFGFAFAEGALAQMPALRVIFMSGHDDDAFVERAFELGASAYLLKTDAMEELTAAVEHVLRGQRYVSSEILGRFPRIDLAPEDAAIPTRLALLTPREREVLRAVSEGKSVKEISRLLNISAWTVTNHKANIMAKLDIHNQVGLTRFAMSTGLLEL
jgi:two-component system nitrate/nitrite response regulator NarL